MTYEQQALLGRAEASAGEVRYLIAGGYYGSAISRAYYGMFYLAQALLLGKGLSASSHKQTIIAFGREFAKTGELPQEFHAYLIAGQEDRLGADYDVLASFTLELAEERLKQLAAFLETVRSYLAGEHLGS